MRTTLTGGIQTLDDTGRWVARVTYLIRDSELLPISADIRLRPPCPGHPGWVTAKTGFGRRRHYVDDDGILHTEGEVGFTPPEQPCDCPWPTAADTAAELDEVPPPGLTLTHLRKISINADIVRSRGALRTVLDLQASLDDDPAVEVGRHVSAEPDSRPRVGRPRRERLPLLRALQLYQDGRKITDIATEIGYSPSWVKDALSWSRKEGMLIGGRGRGARAGVMSPAAEQELGALELQAKKEAGHGVD